MDLINGIDTVISYMYMGTGQRSVPQELNGEYWTYTKKCGPIRLTDWPTPYIYIYSTYIISTMYSNISYTISLLYQYDKY